MFCIRNDVFCHWLRLCYFDPRRFMKNESANRAVEQFLAANDTQQLRKVILPRPFCLCNTEKMLTHWGQVTHICVSKLTTIGSDNGLSPGRRQAIIWTSDGILLIRTLGKNFSEFLSEIISFSFKKMHLKMSSAKWRLFRLGFNELKVIINDPRHTWPRTGDCIKLYEFFYGSRYANTVGRNIYQA